MGSLQISKCRLTASLLIGFVWALPLQIASAANIYKWVDESGVTHYSNKKPAGVKWKLMPEARLSVIPGERIGAAAARAARNGQTRTDPAAASPSAARQRLMSGASACYGNVMRTTEWTASVRLTRNCGLSEFSRALQ